MQVDDIGGAGDELRVARVRGDKRVQALTEVPDSDRACRGGVADRQVEVERALKGMFRRKQRSPADARNPLQRDGSTRRIGGGELTVGSEQGACVGAGTLHLWSGLSRRADQPPRGVIRL